MSETDTRSRPAMMTDDPFGGMSFESPRAVVQQQQFSAAGPRVDQAMAQIVTAQRVAVKRDTGAILGEAKALAAANGQSYFYRIPFKNRQKGTTEYVEGPSIGCAMGAVSVYGNCSVEAFPAQETSTHTTFMARFIDYEKGVTVVRSFQQRKSQNTGMKDDGRAEDIIFQIGQSKAMRNVIVAALPWLTNEMHQAAKNGLIERINRDPEKVRSWLLGKLDELDIDIDRVNRVVGRAHGKWLTTDMAKLYIQVQSIIDKMADAEDMFPTNAAEGAELRDAEDAKSVPQADKPAAAAAPATTTRKAAAPKSAPAAAPAKAADPAPEQEKPAVVEQAKPAAQPTPAAAKEPETAAAVVPEEDDGFPIPEEREQDRPDDSGELTFS